MRHPVCNQYASVSTNLHSLMSSETMASEEGVSVVRKPPIETASWCYRDKEEDVHHDFAWTITNFSRKISVVPNSE